MYQEVDPLTTAVAESVQSSPPCSSVTATDYQLSHIHKHIHPFTFTCTYSHIHTHSCIYIYTFTFTHSHSHAPIHTFTVLHTFTFTHSHTFTISHAPIHTLTHTHITLTHSHSHAHTFRFTRLHSHIHIDIHTFTFTHIHIHGFTCTHSHGKTSLEVCAGYTDETKKANWAVRHLEHRPRGHLPFFGHWAHRWIDHQICHTWLVWRQTHSYLPSHRASLPLGRYQLVLLDDRGTCVWTTCSELLLESGLAGNRTRDLTTPRLERR